jgi:hypothetical protein
MKILRNSQTGKQPFRRKYSGSGWAIAANHRTIAGRSCRSGVALSACPGLSHFVIPGLTRNPAETTSARLARHWIPAFAGMTVLPIACRINHSKWCRSGISSAMPPKLKNNSTPVLGHYGRSEVPLAVGCGELANRISRERCGFFVTASYENWRCEAKVVP